jgi:NADH dehydrogenase
LVKAGYEVRCLVLDEAGAEKVKSHSVDIIIGDVTDTSSIKPAMSGINIVIHMVGILTGRNWAHFDSVNVQGTKNVIKAARQGEIERFIHMGVLGASMNSKFHYFHSKWLGEAAVWASGLDYTILKPSVMFGQGAGFINAILRSIRMFPFLAPIAGSGKTLFQAIWVEDVVSCLIRAVEGDKVCQSCEIGGPEQLSYEQIVKIVSQAAGLKRIKMHIPLALMMPVVSVLEKLMTNPPVNVDGLRGLDINMVTDLDSVERQFGFKPIPIENGLNYLNP